LAAMGEHIPYSTVFASTEGEIDEADLAWAVHQITGVGASKAIDCSDANPSEQLSNACKYRPIAMRPKFDFRALKKRGRLGHGA